MAGSLLTGVIAGGLMAVGAGGAAAPRLLSKGYGIAPDGPQATAYVRAVGLRDIVCGGSLFCALGSGSPTALRGTILWTAVIAAGDFAIVAGARGRAAARNLSVHAGGVIALLGVWAILRAEAEPS